MKFNMRTIHLALTAFGIFVGTAFTQSPENTPANPAGSPQANPTPAVEPTETIPPAGVRAVPSPKASATPEDRQALINTLGETQIEAATNALREGFVQPLALSERELRRAQFSGLLERLGPGAHLEMESDEAVRAGTPFLGEVIDGRIGYIRLHAVDAADLAQMDALLADFVQKNIPAVILDLRGVDFGSDFEAAAEMARRFAPKGQLLFRLDRPGAKQERLFTANQDPVFNGKVVVLTGPGTAGAAEVLAGVLRNVSDAILLGQTTAGKPVEYQILPLGGGLRLRFAVAEAALGNDQRFFQRGLEPDLWIDSDPEKEREIFRLSSERGVSDFIFEKERPRMNEAALIANSNPEIEASGSPQTSAPLDQPLQRAVDIVTALQLFQP
jgi:hypothetical protein